MEKQTQLSSRLEYAQLGLADHTAEILNSQFENFTGLGIANATGEKEPYNREDINAGVNTTITPVKFTKAIEITEEIENLTNDLFRSIFNIINNYYVKNTKQEIRSFVCG